MTTNMARLVAGRAARLVMETDAAFLPPSYPLNLSAATEDDDAVSLTWDDAPDALGYEYRYSLRGEEDWSEPLPAESGVVVDGLEASTYYDFQVRSVDGEGESDWSPSVTEHTEHPAQSAWDVLDDMGLRSSALLCLDAGDEASAVPDNVQEWFDLTAGNADFIAGTSSGSVEGVDPAFVSDGLASHWRFSRAANDRLTLAGAVPSWLNAMHKDGAEFTVLAWVRGIEDAGMSFGYWWGNLAASPNQQGTRFGVGSVSNGRRTFQFRVTNNANGGVKTVSTSALLVPLDGQWYQCGVAIDETAGAAGLDAFVDELFFSADATYASPSADDCATAPKIGSGGVSNAFNGDVALILVLDFKATREQVVEIRDRLSPRFS